MELYKKQRKSGISLIVLVITIIIMIILAAAIILSLNSSNVVSKANEAKEKNDWASSQEKKTVLESEILLKKSTGETINIEDETVGNFELSYDSSNKKIDTKYVETTGDKRKALIPEGFTYLEGTIDTGMVITDSEGNEFVWIPITYIATGTNDANGLDTGFTAVFKRKEYNKGVSMSGCTEPYASGYTNENTEYYDMMRSVQYNRGFYIARYEAGDGDATSKRSGVTSEQHKVVSKKGAYVYNYVGWGNSMSNVESDIIVDGTNKGKGAVYLSHQMYAESTSVVSTLCYGVQWDAALQFISSDASVYDSSAWGNYSNSTGAAATNSGSSKMNYTTGRNESWKAKNIYDMAGNLWEWTMEAYSTFYRVIRGGYYDFFGSSDPASYRGVSSPSSAPRRRWFSSVTLHKVELVLIFAGHDIRNVLRRIKTHKNMTSLKVT